MCVDRLRYLDIDLSGELRASDNTWQAGRIDMICAIEMGRIYGACSLAVAYIEAVVEVCCQATIDTGVDHKGKDSAMYTAAAIYIEWIVAYRISSSAGELRAAELSATEPY